MEEKKQEPKEKPEGRENGSQSATAPEGSAAPAGEGKAAEAAETAQAGGAASSECAEGEVDTAEDLRQQLEAQSDRYLRLMAEFDNFKKRVSRDYERLIESANERLVGELIEVRENFERAIKSGEQICTDKNFFEGMRLIYSKFEGILAKQGLDPFGAAGEPFDPQLHEALMKTPNDSIPEDYITEVFEKGYRLKKRVIKHARVVVSSGPPPKRAETGAAGANATEDNGK